MLRASVFNPGTPALLQVTESTLVTTGSPQWTYTLKPVGLEYNAGAVKPFVPTPQESTTLTGYNVHELGNTTSLWFGLAPTEYKGLDFEPTPTGRAVLAFVVPFEMVDAAGAYDSGAPDEVAVFHWPNQLSGDCD